MNNPEYRPPVHLEDVMGKIEGPDGYVSSVSLLLRDANGKLFSLHVATQVNHAATLGESGEDHAEFPEPVFVVPAMTIDEQLVEDIVDGTKPEVLGMYLVAQVE